MRQASDRSYAILALLPSGSTRVAAGLAFLAVLLGLGPGPEAWAQLNPLCALSDERYRVELARLGACCPAVMDLLVEDRESGRVHELQLEARLQRIVRARILEDSILAIVGRFGIGGRSIVFVDLSSRRPPDEIWTYGHQFSPSRRYLAYISYYPTEETEPALERSILLLYEPGGSPRENRLGQPESLNPANAGIPIFPQANAAQGSYDPRLESKHIFLSPLLWSPEEDRLVFVELFEGSHHLVSIDLAGGAHPAPISRRVIPPREYLTERGLRQLRSGERVQKRFAVVGMRFKDESTLVLQISGDQEIKDTVELSGLPPL